MTGADLFRRELNKMIGAGFQRKLDLLRLAYGSDREFVEQMYGFEHPNDASLIDRMEYFRTLSDDDIAGECITSIFYDGPVPWDRDWRSFDWIPRPYDELPAMPGIGRTEVVPSILPNDDIVRGRESFVEGRDAAFRHDFKLARRLLRRSYRLLGYKTGYGE